MNIALNAFKANCKLSLFILLHLQFTHRIKWDVNILKAMISENCLAKQSDKSNFISKIE